MIRDIQQYWREIRQIEASLEEFVWLMAIDPARARGNGNAREAHPVEMAAANAAQLLHRKSHRLATEKEIAAHRARETDLNRAAKIEQLRREGRAQVVISDQGKQ